MLEHKDWTFVVILNVRHMSVNKDFVEIPGLQDQGEQIDRLKELKSWGALCLVAIVNEGRR
jgi:hypothetical protein